jgi:hypothetical protein
MKKLVCIKVITPVLLLVTSVVLLSWRALACGECRGCSPDNGCYGIINTCDPRAPGFFCPCSVPCDGGSTSCFLPGTLVATPEGAKKIEDVAKGDVVESYDPLTGKVTQNIAGGYETVIRDHYYKLWTKSGKMVGTTDDHPFYIGLDNPESKSIPKRIMALFNITGIYFGDGVEIVKSALGNIR